MEYAVKQELRDRTQQVMRTELANAALDLIVAHGYDSLTVEGLARGIGISRATFFRYFGTKDEAVITAMLEPNDLFAASFAATSIEDGSLWHRLRLALEPTVVKVEADPERMRTRISLIQSQPMLGAQLRRARFSQTGELAAALKDAGLNPLTAEVLSAASVAVLDHCFLLWIRGQSETLRKILDESFVQLERTGRN